MPPVRVGIGEDYVRVRRVGVASVTATGGCTGPAPASRRNRRRRRRPHVLGRRAKHALVLVTVATAPQGTEHPPRVGWPFSPQRGSPAAPFVIGRGALHPNG